MADVVFAFVYDFGAGEQWWARRGEGAWLRRRRGWIRRCRERRARDGRLEVLGIEAADPRWVPASIDGLVVAPTGCGRWARSLPRCVRSLLRASTAWSRCATRRGIDAAAGQLIVREAGGW